MNSLEFKHLFLLSHSIFISDNIPQYIHISLSPYLQLQMLFMKLEHMKLISKSSKKNLK